MKKQFLLIVSFVAGIMTASAQTNLVKNGNFEDVANTEFATFQLNDDEKATYAKTIPGWDKGNDKDAVEATNGFNGLSVWNVYANILEQEPDEDKILEGNTHHLRLQRYDYNGWATGVLKQTIDGLTVGDNYDFSMLYRFNIGDHNGDDPVAAYEVTEIVDGKEGNKLLGNDKLPDDPDNWMEVKGQFKATTTSVVVKVSLDNPWRESQWNENVWADYDEVTLTDATTNGITNVKKAVPEDGAYYTLSGIKTTKPCHGVYVRNGKKVIVK